ncbi:transposase [candidate division KSB1 bacterium]
MRKKPFVNGEFYHIYNRGVDKRITFKDRQDIERFLQSIEEFNTTKPIGSIYENSFKINRTQLGGPTPKLGKLVEFVSYCINPNHYHFIVTQKKDGGISEFMKRLSGGYTSYFNNRHKRSGVLFQGKFKSVHINTNEYLLHLSAYVNLNNRVHQLGGRTTKLVRSSWDEYIGKGSSKEGIFCKKDIILDQFKTPVEYRRFAESSLNDILKRRYQEDEITKHLTIEKL